MSRYVDIEPIIASHTNAEYKVSDISFAEVLHAPSIEVVMCKECKHASDNKVYGCMLNHFNDDDYHRMYANDFCSYGVRTDASETDKHDKAVEALGYLIKRMKGADDE